MDPTHQRRTGLRPWIGFEREFDVWLEEFIGNMIQDRHEYEVPHDRHQKRLFEIAQAMPELPKRTGMFLFFLDDGLSEANDQKNHADRKDAGNQIRRGQRPHGHKTTDQRCHRPTEKPIPRDTSFPLCKLIFSTKLLQGIEVERRLRSALE